MAINFPVPTVLNQEHTDPTTSIVYIWVGTVSPVSGFWQVKSAPSGSTPPPSGGGNASIFVGDAPPTTPGENQLWWNSNNGRMYLYYDDGNTVQWVETSPGVTTPDALPVGSILPIASTNVPAGFIECDGRAIGRVTFSDLFAEIGTIWGVGDGTTTFNVPDLRGEFLRGWDHGRYVDNVGSFNATKTTGNATLTGLSIDAKLIENGMLVVGTGIPNNSTILSFTVVAGLVQTITLNQLVSGSGSVRINIFGRKFGSVEMDAIQNITARVVTQSKLAGASGAFTATSEDDGGFNGSGLQPETLNFNASNVVKTTDNETRPRNQAVMYVIKAFATTTNPGMIDVGDLANDVAALQNTTWVSPLQPITQTAINVITTPKVTLTHGLGVRPKKVYGQLICKAPFLHYQIGDVLPVYDYITDAQIQGLKLQWNATTITYQLCGHGFVVYNMDGAWNDYRSCYNTMLVNYFDFVIIAEK